MVCKVCKAPGARFCIPCRARYGGRTVRVVRSSPRAATSSKSAPRRRRRKAAPSSSGRKHLSREVFLRRMRAGKLRAARRRGRK